MKFFTLMRISKRRILPRLVYYFVYVHLLGVDLLELYRRPLCGIITVCRVTCKSFCHLVFPLSKQYSYIIIWLVPRAGKMNQIVHCDWLPERARWSHLARSGLPAVSRQQNFSKSHIINPLLTKFVRARWLDIGQIIFLQVYGPLLRLGP